MGAPYAGQPFSGNFGSLQRSVDAAPALEPAMTVGFIAFPSTTSTSLYHFGVFLRDDSAVTSRLYSPVLPDARSSTVTDSRTLT